MKWLVAIALLAGVTAAHADSMSPHLTLEQVQTIIASRQVVAAPDGSRYAVKLLRANSPKRDRFSFEVEFIPLPRTSQ